MGTGPRGTALTAKREFPFAVMGEVKRSDPNTCPGKCPGETDRQYCERGVRSIYQTMRRIDPNFPAYTEAQLEQEIRVCLERMK